MRMPVLVGFGFLKTYQAPPEAQQCAKVVAVLTTSLHPRDLDRAAPFSVAAYLTKSPTADKIRALVLERFAPPMLLP